MQERYGVEVWFAFRDANKSGLNWAMQEVLPQIVQLKDVHSVELRARAFRPADKHFDLVHRFLQELYPFDAILADSLSLPLERIRLQLAEDSAAPMFSVCALPSRKRCLPTGAGKAGQRAGRTCRISRSAVVCSFRLQASG